jgi:hypothetical protein
MNGMLIFLHLYRDTVGAGHLRDDGGCCRIRVAGGHHLSQSGHMVHPNR